MQKSKIIIFKGFWSKNDVEKHPDCLFVYGDNDAGIGKGGQAIIRDLSNTIGIPTKKYPSNHASSFYSDTEYDKNIAKIDYAIEKIIILSKKYKYVILPEDGFGTGLADLPKKAPKTFDYLVKAVDSLKTKI